MDNISILNRIRLNGTTDYQQRIPEATQANVSLVMNRLLNPAYKAQYNEFLNGLINRIGRTIVRQRRWENPLAFLKKESLLYGSTIQEIHSKLLKAQKYDQNDFNALFRMSRPEVVAAYHEVNREDRYDITLNEVYIKRAMVNGEDLSAVIANMLEIPYTSDQYDEYNIMVNLITEYQKRLGFYNVQVPDLTSLNASEADGKKFSKILRSYAQYATFLRTDFNPAGIPVAAPGLVLFTTPEVQANLDVEVLASAFNISKAEIPQRVVILDRKPFDGFVAVLASEDWFVCGDTVYETTSFYNPATLTTNYFLHHQGIYSVSPFMPAILFSTNEGTGLTTVIEEITGIEAICHSKDNTTPVTRIEVGDSGKYKIEGVVSGSVNPANEGVYLLPNSYIVKSMILSGVEQNSRTYIDRDNVLYLQDLPADYKGTLTIEIEGTYTNPDNVAETFTDTLVLGIGQDAPAPTEEVSVNFSVDAADTDKVESVPEAITVDAGEAITLPSLTLTEQASTNGFDFGGWYDGSKIYQAGSKYKVNSNVTLEAVIGR